MRFAGEVVVQLPSYFPPATAAPGKSITAQTVVMRIESRICMAVFLQNREITRSANDRSEVYRLMFGVFRIAVR